MAATFDEVTSNLADDALSMRPEPGHREVSVPVIVVDNHLLEPSNIIY